MTGEEIVSMNFIRVAYIATVRPSVHPSLPPVTRLNGRSPTRSGFRSVRKSLEPSTKFPIVIAHSPGYSLHSPPQQYSWVPRAGGSLDDWVPDSGSILEGCYRRDNGRTMTSPLINGTSFGGKGESPRVRRRLSVSELFVPSSLLSRDPVRDGAGGTPLSFPSRTAKSTGRRDRSD